MVKMGPVFVRCTREAPARSSMIGLVLVTHGRLAVEFRSALEHVVGPQTQIEVWKPPRERAYVRFVELDESSSDDAEPDIESSRPEKNKFYQIVNLI